jgi:flavin reductase (DIM6/NTAB) family NADH-FMN oxidoreductase RutF
VAARDNEVAVAWFTARDDSPKVQLAVSNDSGASFGEPTLVAGPDTNGRVDTVILASGQVVVSWLSTEAADATIMLSRFSAAGQFMDSIKLATTSASRRSGFPIIESVENTVYVSWTDISDAPRVRVARVNFDG